jgi:hypothetical protein
MASGPELVSSSVDAAAIAPVCPLCHTVDTTVTMAALHDGGSWRCVTCDQVWSERRLNAVAAYAQYAATH